MIKAGGFFGLLAAFAAWYNALAGIADDSNRYASLFWFSIRVCTRVFVLEHFADGLAPSFFIVPVIHFPWSSKGKEMRMEKSERQKV